MAIPAKHEAQPTIRIEQIIESEDYTPPAGYVLNELKTSTAKGKGLFYAVLLKIPEGGFPQAPKPAIQTLQR